MSVLNRAGFWEAMRKELHTLFVDKLARDMVSHESWMNVLPSISAFKCSRFPDGIIRKLKARFCICGDRQQKGIDYFGTFASVVNLITVWIMPILLVLLNLATLQVNYTAAFVHAPIDRVPC